MTERIMFYLDMFTKTDGARYERILKDEWGKFYNSEIRRKIYIEGYKPSKIITVMADHYDQSNPFYPNDFRSDLGYFTSITEAVNYCRNIAKRQQRQAKIIKNF